MVLAYVCGTRSVLIRSSKSRRNAVLGLAGIVGPLLFTVAWIIRSLTQEGYSARREDISALAALTADSAWLMIAGFVAVGVGTIALALGLMSVFKGSPLQRIGPVLILLVGIGLIVAGLMRNDCSSFQDACKALVDNNDVSWHHQAHDGVSLIVFLALIIAPLLMAGRFMTLPEWTSLRMPSMVLTPVLLVLLVLFGSEAFPSVEGIIQRVLVTLAMAWLAVVGLRLYQTAQT